MEAAVGVDEPCSHGPDRRVVEGLEQRSEPAGSHLGIAVQQHDVVASGLGGSDVGRPQVTLVLGVGDQPQTADPGEEVGNLVGRRIVDDDHLVIDVGVAGDRLEQSFGDVGAPVDRHHQAGHRVRRCPQTKTGLGVIEHLIRVVRMANATAVNGLAQRTERVFVGGPARRSGWQGAAGEAPIRRDRLVRGRASLHVEHLSQMGGFVDELLVLDGQSSEVLAGDLEVGVQAVHLGLGEGLVGRQLAQRRVDGDLGLGSGRHHFGVHLVDARLGRGLVLGQLLGRGNQTGCRRGQWDRRILAGDHLRVPLAGETLECGRTDPLRFGLRDVMAFPGLDGCIDEIVEVGAVRLEPRDELRHHRFGIVDERVEGEGETSGAVEIGCGAEHVPLPQGNGQFAAEAVAPLQRCGNGAG